MHKMKSSPEMVSSQSYKERDVQKTMARQEAIIPQTLIVDGVLK
jgi:hypothetical protein